MNDKYNKKLTGISQALRRQMTQQERRLWYEFLKELPITFHRQKVIGRYIVDFYCASAKIVIEIDGTQHFLDKGKQSDAERDEFLSSLGLTVLRYSNDDINTSFESVCQDIFNHLITCGAFPRLLLEEKASPQRRMRCKNIRTCKKAVGQTGGLFLCCYQSASSSSAS